jgi:hypothetical protein
MVIATRERAGKSWSDMEIIDLRSGLAFGTPIEEIADFLVRDREEVRKKAASLNSKPQPH